MRGFGSGFSVWGFLVAAANVEVVEGVECFGMFLVRVQQIQSPAGTLMSGKGRNITSWTRI